MDAGARPAQRPLLVDRACLLLRAVCLVSGAGTPNKVPDRNRLHPVDRRLGPGNRQYGRRSGADLSRCLVRPGRQGMGVDGSMRRICALLCGADRPRTPAVLCPALPDGAVTRLYGIRAYLGEWDVLGWHLTGTR